MDSFETDYLIVGAGASGLAFADTLLDETDAHITLVDRRDKPGGHWNDAYPFVQAINLNELSRCCFPLPRECSTPELRQHRALFSRITDKCKSYLDHIPDVSVEIALWQMKQQTHPLIKPAKKPKPPSAKNACARRCG